MAFDAFLKIAAIPGESTDTAHPSWIEVFEFGHSMAQNNIAEVSTSGGRSVGRVEFEKFTIVKNVDSSSPLLYVSLCKGTHHPTAIIRVYRSADVKQLYLKYTLLNAIISNIDSSGSGGEDKPRETVSLVFSKITWEFYKTANDLGDEVAPVTGNWNLIDNTGSN